MMQFGRFNLMAAGWRGLSIAVLASTWLVAVLPTNPSQGAQRDGSSELEALVTDLIEQLGHDSFRVRSNAQAALERIGLAAFEQLRQALDHPNIQVARSAEYLLLSQNVTWWLDTDSQGVRERLQDYSSLSVTERHTRLQQLALLGTDDALMALCRVAKFESQEWISRAAALSLLTATARLNEERQALLARSILMSIQRTDRMATKWLVTYARQLLDHAPSELSAWREYADELNLEVSQNRRTRPEQRLQVLQYYEWLTGWAAQHQGRQASLEMVRPSMQLVERNPKAVREYGHWALSVDLPELVIELAAGDELFNNDPKLTYLLAEALRHQGEEDTARQLALKALHLPENRANLLGQLARGGAGEIEAGQRYVQASELRERGMFDWAEAEYLEALKPESRLRVEIREMLGHFYWEGGQFRQAAEILQPLIEAEPIDKNLPGVQHDHYAQLALYHWYRAQEATQQADRAAEMHHFRLALQANSEAEMQNPDILIGLYRTVATEEERQYFQTQFDSMISHFRSLVAAEEARLAQSNLGQFSNVGIGLAQACNQLAWLLANCETHVDEALYLSGRSLEFDPDSYAYLDTMARCCYAAGRLEEAVEYQKRAVGQSPHDRMMKAQLVDFQQALAAGRSAATSGGHEREEAPVEPPR